MKYVAFASFALALVISAPAAAQNFNGPSVGAQVGWSHDDIRGPKTDLGTLPVQARKDSATVGGFAAYDKEIGRFVIGGELGFMLGASDTATASGGGATYSIDPRRSFDASLRGGYLINPKTLVYGRAGYTNERFRTTVNTGATSVIHSQDRDGWTLGAGVERVIIPHVSARVEYRYADLSDGTGKWDRHQVLTGIAYRF
ncbi:MAG: outer membrane protein [Pseudomonadota bacterium]